MTTRTLPELQEALAAGMKLLAEVLDAFRPGDERVRALSQMGESLSPSPGRNSAQCPACARLVSEMAHHPADDRNTCSFCGAFMAAKQSLPVLPS